MDDRDLALIMQSQEYGEVKPEMSGDDFYTGGAAERPLPAEPADEVDDDLLSEGKDDNVCSGSSGDDQASDMAGESDDGIGEDQQCQMNAEDMSFYSDENGI